MVAMLGYVVIAVTCRRPPPRKYTHDDGGGGLAGLNARKRKTVPRVIRECESREQPRRKRVYCVYLITSRV